MQDTFPNVAIALRMYLVLMVTNCSAERSFTKLKLIESRLRTSMTQGRLVNLAIMSIESDILREIDFADISMTLLRQNRERCLVFEFRLCVGRYDLKVLYMHDCVILILIIIWLIIILKIIFKFVTY